MKPKRIFLIGVGIFFAAGFVVFLDKQLLVDKEIKPITVDVPVHASSPVSNTTQIDDYFWIENGVVYYHSLYAQEFGLPISTTTKVAEHADAETFTRISDSKHRSTNEGGNDTILYKDKNNTYSFSIYRGLAGVYTNFRVAREVDLQ